MMNYNYFLQNLACRSNHSKTKNLKLKEFNSLVKIPHCHLSINSNAIIIIFIEFVENGFFWVKIANKIFMLKDK